jgi:hypothetical protein
MQVNSKKIKEKGIPVLRRYFLSRNKRREKGNLRLWQMMIGMTMLTERQDEEELFKLLNQAKTFSLTRRILSCIT